MRRRFTLAGSSVLTAVLLLAIAAEPAVAGTGHGHVLGMVPMAGIPIIGDVLGGIGHAVLGAFSWTFHLASKFILVTVGALVKLLIPRSWAREGVQVFEWIVAIPDYAGTITSPSGQTSYGFAGVNDIRQLFEWLGLALLPLTLVYSTGRAMLGQGEPVAAPIARVVALAGVLVSYAWWWAQAAALVNQLTNVILSPAVVTDGIHRLMLYATGGIALGGWQLIDLALMAALAIELLMLIFVKVVLILLGALLFATGPLTLGLVPTSSGAMLARAWLSAVMTLLALPVVWAAVFAIGAVLVVDAGTAGPLIGGSSTIGNLLGGVILAIAGAATLWLCVRAAREVGGLLRLQLGGLLVLAGQATHSHHASPASASPPAHSAAGRAASSIRSFGARVGDAAHSSAVAAGPGGQRIAAAAGLAGRAGRRGLIITGGQAIGTAGRASARAAAGSAARQHVAGGAATAALAAGERGPGVGRAGAVVSRMARAGHASWRASATHARAPKSSTGNSASTASARRAVGRDELPGSDQQPGLGGVPRPRAGETIAPAGARQDTATGSPPASGDHAAPRASAVAGERSATPATPATAARANARPSPSPPPPRGRVPRGTSPTPGETAPATRSARRPASPTPPPQPGKPTPSPANPSDAPPSAGSGRDE